MKRFFVAVLAIFFAAHSQAQWHSIGAMDSLSVSKQGVVVFSGKSALAIDVLSNDLVHIRLAPSGVFDDSPTPAVIKHEWPGTNVALEQTAEAAELRFAGGRVRITRNPVRLSFLDSDGTVISADDAGKGMAWDGDEIRVWKNMPQDECYYGFGEKAGRLMKRDASMTMWNSDIPSYQADTDPIYESIPMFYGIRGGKAYGIFFDNSYRSSFDMGKESNRYYSFGASGGELNYYFFYGPSPEQIVSRYTELVGRMHLPPLWSLGYQQCRWSYAPEARVREIAQNFRTRKIPADVIYLDIDYMEGYRIFTWSHEKFPHPKKMIDDLSAMGFKIAVIVDPGIKNDPSYHAFRSGSAGDLFLKYPDGRPYVGKVWPGECVFPDFSNPAARKWWGAQFKVLADAGVRGWWNDMNEPSVFDVPTKTIDLSVIHNDNGHFTTHAKNHNTYGLQMTQATYEGVRRLLPEERPFVLTRASFAGGQRYSAAWTGDNEASWKHLQMVLPMCLNLSISGQPFVGSDIGGFVGYPSGELFARWLEVGVFTPLMRAHSVINEKNKEPWEYGAKFEAINRSTIELRYKLLPYIYTTMQQASETGVPAMRPMAFAYPADPIFHWEQTEFMFGPDLLVAPVLWEGATTRSLRLPEGTWFDFWTDQRYEGGRNITVAAPIDRIPIFVRGGASIPTGPVVQFVGEHPVDPLTITVYPGPASSSLYYRDDGRTFDYEKGEFEKRTIEQSAGGSGRTVILSKAEGTFDAPARRLKITFVGMERKPAEVTVNGRTVRLLLDRESGKGTDGWTYDAKKSRVMVNLQDSPSKMIVSVR